VSHHLSGQRPTWAVATLLTAITLVLAVLPAKAATGDDEVAGSSQTTAAKGTDTDGDGDPDRPDTASASATARVLKKRVEDLSQRTEDKRSFANADGTWTDEQYGGVARVQAEDGTWDNVDYDLAQQPDGSWAPKVSPVDVTIDGGSSREAARVTFDDGQSLAVTWPQPLPDPTVDGSIATYKLSDSTDLVVMATSRGVNTHIRLNNAPTEDDPVFELGLRANNLDVKKSGAGLKMVDDDGKAIGNTSTLVAWDSKTDESGAPLEIVPLESALTDEGTSRDVTNHALELKTPVGYLTDPATQYPVTIDPDIGSLEQLRDTYVRSGDTNHYYDNNIAVGKVAGESNSGAARAYLKFHTGSQIPGQQIVRAELRLWQFFAGTPNCEARPMQMYPVTSAWNSGMTWTSQPQVTGVWGLTVNENHGSSCGDTWTRADVTGMVQGWANGSIPNEGIRLAVPPANEGTAAYGRKFCSMESSGNTVCNTYEHMPILSVTYNRPPDQPSRVEVSPIRLSGVTGITTNPRPTFSARMSDPDGGVLQPYLRVTNLATGTYSDNIPAQIISGGTVTHQWQTDLPDGRYSVFAFGHDGTLWAPHGPATSFTVDTTSVRGYGKYVPVTPSTFLNTATGLGSPSGRMTTTATAQIQIAGKDGIPNGTTAVFATVKADKALGTGSLQVGASDQPLTSAPGPLPYKAEIPAQVGRVLRVGSDGKVSAKLTASSSDVHVSIDVLGYFTDDPKVGGFYNPLTTTSLYSSATSSPLGAGESRTVQIGGVGGLPGGQAATAAVIDVTAKNWTASGALSIHNSDDNFIEPTNVEFRSSSGSSQSAATATTVVALADEGTVTVHNSSPASVDFELTASGWYSAEEPAFPEPAAYGLDSYQYADFETIAADAGVPVETILQKAGWEFTFNDVVDEIIDLYPASFASAELDPPGPGLAEVRFKGPTPPGVTQMLSAVAVPVTVVPNEPLNATEQAEAASAAGEAIESQVASAEIMAAYDPETARVKAVVFVPREDGTVNTPDLQRRATSAINSSADLHVDGVDIELSDESFLQTTQQVRGGSTLRYFPGSGLRCTTGFTASRKSDGAPGVLTAEHCGDDYQTSFETQSLYGTSARLSTRNGDIEFHATRKNDGHGTPASFYYDVGEKRQVTGIRRPTSGEKICTFGRKSNRKTCFVIDKNGVYVKYDTGEKYYNMTTTLGCAVQSGDSGGPWFLGGEAIGITSGRGHRERHYDVCFFTPLYGNLSNSDISVKVAR
jgi:hypothetical protein